MKTIFKNILHMKKLLFLLTFAGILFSSCATIISGQKQMVSFSSQPSGAEIRIDGKTIGTTPITTNIKRTSKTVNFHKDGHTNSNYRFNKKFNGWYIGNILLGGLPGMIVDLIVGSYINIDDNVYKNLEKQKVEGDVRGISSVNSEVNKSISADITFQMGDKVMFKNKRGKIKDGIIVGIGQNTAIISYIKWKEYIIFGHQGTEKIELNYNQLTKVR